MFRIIGLVIFALAIIIVLSNVSFSAEPPAVDIIPIPTACGNATGVDLMLSGSLGDDYTSEVLGMFQDAVYSVHWSADGRVFAIVGTSTVDGFGCIHGSGTRDGSPMSESFDSNT